MQNKKARQRLSTPVSIAPAHHTLTRNESFTMPCSFSQAATYYIFPAHPMLIYSYLALCCRELHAFDPHPYYLQPD